jgi:hypothetical protein
VEEDDPVDVRLLGAAAVVAGADRLPHAVEEPGLRGAGRAGFMDAGRPRERAAGKTG